MNREQAGAEALKMLNKLMDDTGWGILVRKGDNYCVYRTCYDAQGGGNPCGEFPYDPPIEAPPRRTIVEVWDDDPGYTMLGFSSGELKDGKLMVSWRREPPYDSCFRHWRIVEVAK